MGEKILAFNKKAKHDYFLEDFYEAGLVLSGTEIKSIRLGKIQLKESFISFVGHEAFIKGMHVSHYEQGNIFNHDETRERKLLLNKLELKKLQQKVKLGGYTIVPTKIYLKNGRAKLEIALAKGKNLYDKRQTDKERSVKRELQKAVKNFR